MVLKVILVLIILMLIVGAILMSSIYVVRQQSVAIIERFGKYQKLSNSGIHLRAPFGIDKIAASADVEHTSFQSTAPIVAVVPIVATNVCAAVFNALFAAAFAHLLQ